MMLVDKALHENMHILTNISNGVNKEILMRFTEVGRLVINDENMKYNGVRT